MTFRLNTASGTPLYLQLVEQVRHAIETGVLQHGDVLPSIRTLSHELVISHNTIAKAFAELEHEGLLDLRHGSGAYVLAPRRGKSRTAKLLSAQNRIRAVVAELLGTGFSPDEIRRMTEAELNEAQFSGSSQTGRFS